MKPMLVVALALAAGCTGGKATTSLPPDQAKQLLINRNWIDHLPQKIDDKLHVYRFVPSMGGGVFQDRTIFFGTFELFAFETDGEKIRFNLLHTGDKKTSRFTIAPLDPPGPDGVDLKLTIDDDPRGQKVYYGWRKESRDLDGQLAKLAVSGR